MVVFKRKTPKAVQISPSQTPQSLANATPEPAAAPTTEQHDFINTATLAPMSYSDIAAGRDARVHGTPIEKLMYIPELCDEVLGYLSMGELLHATQVCHAFKTNIANSSCLQAKLSLAPDLTMKKLAVSSTGTLLSGVKAEQHIASAQAAGDGKSGAIELYVPHPWLRSAYLPDRYKSMGMVMYATILAGSHHGHNDASMSFRDLRTVFTLPRTSSLHKMLLCQPPLEQVTASYIAASISKRSPLMQQLLICNSGGVTIGDVIKALQDRLHPSGLEAHFDSIVSTFSMTLEGGFLVNSLARSLAQRSPELGSNDDPTTLARVYPDFLAPVFLPAVAGGFVFTPR